MRTLYFHPVISSSSFFFFSLPNLSGHRVDVYHNSTWCGLSANLECRSEMCSTWLAGNTGCKNDAKKSTSADHCTNLSGYIFAMRACIVNWKKLVKQQYLLHMSHNMPNFSSLAAEIGSVVWGTPAFSISVILH